MLPSLSKIPLSIREKAITYAPKVLRPTLKLVPFSLHKSLLLPALHSVFKEAIEDGDFEFLTNRWLKISIADLEVNWWLCFENEQLIMANPNNPPQEDVSFSANGDDLVLIAGRKQDPDTLFFQRRLKIEGDTELGLEVKNLIDAIDIDQLPSSVHSAVAEMAGMLELTRQQVEENNQAQRVAV